MMVHCFNTWQDAENEVLKKRIQELEAQQRASAASATSPSAESVKCQLLEERLSKAMEAIDAMKELMQKPDAQKEPESLKAKRKHREPSLEPESDGSESDAESEKSITTPDGTKAPLLNCTKHATTALDALFRSEVPISPDALRMRCRRMCERKLSGKANVDEAVTADYKEGGSKREMLELALLESLAKFGVDRKAHKRIKAGVIRIRLS